MQTRERRRAAVADYANGRPKHRHFILHSFHNIPGRVHWIGASIAVLFVAILFRTRDDAWAQPEGRHIQFIGHVPKSSFR
jgi:hypothetical protein